MSISSNSFLSLPSCLDTLVLSNSSSSISSSASSLFGHDGRLSSSSQTDTSPPISPLKEDEDDKDDKCQSHELERLVPSWKGISETPKPNVLGLLSLVSHQDQGAPKAEYPYAAADEAGYEAEASDSDCYFAVGIRKKKLMKKALSSLARSNYREEYSMSESEDDSECIVFSPSSIFERKDRLPRKPALHAQVLDLNSPSPIIALPSPRIKDHRQYASLNAFLQIDSSPISMSPKHLTERFHIRETTLCNSPQKPLGLGLRLPTSGSSTIESPISPRILSVPAKKRSLPGLGIRLPSAPTSRPSISEFRNKRHSFSSLGHGLPSTLHAPCTLVPSPKATVRLVTPRTLFGDVEQQVPLDVDIPRQRRVSMGFTLPKGSSFPKRHLHPILESPTYSSSTTSLERYHTLPKLKKSRSSRLGNFFSPDPTGDPCSYEVSPRSPSLKRSPLMAKWISPLPVYHELDETWCPVGVDQYLPMSTLATRTLF